MSYAAPEKRGVLIATGVEARYIRLMTAPLSVQIGGSTLSMTVRRNARATRLSVRLNRTGDGLIVSAPLHVTVSYLTDFVLSKADWITAQRTRAPQRVAFVPGAVVPFEGVGREIRHGGPGRGAVRLTPDGLIVSGAPEDIAHRLTGFFKARARTRLVDAVNRHAAALNVPFTGLSIRDTESRWGSCANSGRLSFSWRLILAPPPVLNYVAAHEVAHLVEFNHSPRFWSVVDSLVADSRSHRRWLKTEGRWLHRYG